jgi:hypothetical protein
MEHLRNVLQRLKEISLKLCLTKCFFGLQEMECPSYAVSGGKLSVLTKKIEAVKEWPVLRTQRVARSFVQFCIFP